MRKGNEIKSKLTAKVLANELKDKRMSVIAKEYKVSRQYIHQLKKVYGKKYPELYKEEKITKEKLVKDFKEQLSYTDIIEKYKITRTKLQKLLNEYNIKKPFINKTLVKDKLIDLIENQKLSDKQIATLYNCSVYTVKKIRILNNIYRIKK